VLLKFNLNVSKNYFKIKTKLIIKSNGPIGSFLSFLGGNIKGRVRLTRKIHDSESEIRKDNVDSNKSRLKQPREIDKYNSIHWRFSLRNV